MMYSHPVKRKRNTVLKKLIKYILILILAAAIAVAAVNLIVCLKVNGNVRSLEQSLDDKGYDCIIVLGCGVWDETPTPLLSDRLDAALALYNAGVAPKLLMSGDHGRSNYNEVSVMRRYAMERGVPSEDIFMDHAGFATYDSFYRAGAVFGVKKVVVVTQAYHLPRALWIARALGLEAVGVACDTRRYPGQTYRDVREILARDKDFFKCILKPLPRYLGEAIPIWGSGDATNYKV